VVAAIAANAAAEIRTFLFCMVVSWFEYGYGLGES
jgi:hypothetical protein